MPCEYGQIVLAPVSDGHGHIKIRPVVILTPTTEIQPGGPLLVGGIRGIVPPGRQKRLKCAVAHRLAKRRRYRRGGTIPLIPAHNRGHDHPAMSLHNVCLLC